MTMIKFIVGAIMFAMAAGPVLAKTVKHVNRSAKSGQFVSENYAKRHPATTVREKVK
jgi:hypothetical protein